MVGSASWPKKTEKQNLTHTYMKGETHSPYMYKTEQPVKKQGVFHAWDA